MVHIVNLSDMSEVRTLASHADWVTSLAWSDDGTRLASASRDKSVKVFDSESGELLVSYTGHNAAVRSVVFASDGKTLLSAGADNQLHRWSITDAAKVAGVGVGGEAFRLRRIGEAVWLPSTDRNVRKFECSNNTISQTVVAIRTGHSPSPLHLMASDWQAVRLMVKSKRSLSWTPA